MKASERAGASGICAVFFLLVTLAGCGGGGGGGSSVGPPASHPTTAPTPAPTGSGSGSFPVTIGPSKIKHVIFVIQENRSFDNLFGGLDSSGKPFPGADTVSNPNAGEPTPHDHLGNPVKMTVGALEECYDPFHYHPDSVADVNGGAMNGFDQQGVVQEECAPQPPPADYVYRTIEYSEVQPYWEMGEKYALADRMFEPFSSASFGQHLYTVAAQSDDAIDNPDGTPWGCDAPAQNRVAVYGNNGQEISSIYPCFTMPTLANLLDARGVPWRWYATDRTDFGYNWNAYDAINQIRNGPDWTNGDVVTPPAQFISDVGSGILRPMTWITPTNATSDHAQDHSNLGPGWITSIVDAVGASSFWNTTAMFVMWDDWGGWYDHVPPPVEGPVGLGIRVPLLVISPYAKSGYVSHVVHTSGSVLHFAEEALNLPSLGQEDAREDDLSDMFNFAETPRKFSSFAIKRRADVLRAATKGLPFENRDAQAGD